MFSLWVEVLSVRVVVGSSGDAIRTEGLGSTSCPREGPVSMMVTRDLRGLQVEMALWAGPGMSGCLIGIS